MRISNTHRGFTLIELLAVIAIVATLAALTFAGTKKFITKARTVKCMSNMKQLGAAFHLYAADNSGGFPIQRVEAYPQGSSESWAWQLLPYVDNNTDVLHCSESSPGPYSSYLYNSWAGARANPASAVRISASKNPSKDGLLLDGRPTGGGVTTTTSSGNTGWIGNLPSGWFPHNSTRNVLFVDGHVETTKEIVIGWDWPRG